MGPFTTHAVQAHDDFRFDGKAFAHYARNVLGKNSNIKRIYFPAVYAGKVALALSDAGFEVFAGDLSEYWSERARGFGLRAERRSFEEIPDEKFDAMVTFEPFCVPSPAVYVAVLRAMSRNMPYIEIWSRFEEDGIFMLMYEMRKKAESGKHALQGKTYAEFLGSLRKKKLVRIVNDIHKWEASEYGGRAMAHVVRCSTSSFIFASVIPNENAGKMASLDLKIIADMEGWDRRISISIGELAGRISEKAGDVAGALGRLQRMAARFSAGGEAYAREFLVTE